MNTTSNVVLTYLLLLQIKEWLNLNATRKQLGIPGSVPAYNLSSDVVAIDFDTGGDRLYRSDTHVAQLLERGENADR